MRHHAVSVSTKAGHGTRFANGQVYNYSGGLTTGSGIASYWVSPVTASRTRTGLPTLTAKTVG